MPSTRCRHGGGSKYPQLEDRRWLLTRIAAGDTAHTIGRRIGTDRSALTRHGVTVPPAGTESVIDRLRYVDDVELRVELAAQIEQDALALADRAAAVLLEARAADG